jgi:hypothetical protein
MQEYPKVLYAGVWEPSVGLGGLTARTVNSAKEEKDALKEGYVQGVDVESLSAPKAGKKSSEE